MKAEPDSVMVLGNELERSQFGEYSIEYCAAWELVEIDISNQFDSRGQWHGQVKLIAGNGAEVTVTTPAKYKSPSSAASALTRAAQRFGLENRVRELGYGLRGKRLPLSRAR